MASKNLSISPNLSFQIPRFARMVEIQSGMMSCQKAGTGPKKSSDSGNSKALNVGISRNMTGTSLNFESEEFQDLQWTNMTIWINMVHGYWQGAAELSKQGFFYFLREPPKWCAEA